MAANSIFKCTEGAGIGDYSCKGRGVRKNCPLSSFDTHARWQAVTQIAASRWSYRKKGELWTVYHHRTTLSPQISNSQLKNRLRAVSLFSVVRRAKCETRKWPRARRERHEKKRVSLFSSRTAALVSRVSRLRRSRARALLSLNLKKKRDCSQSS